MNNALNILKPLLLLVLMILMASWGSVGHRKINQHSPASFPYSMEFLKISWTLLLADHASDADDRKQQDPDESAKHYIDIDDYPEFVQSGRIPMTWDSVTALHGVSFVIDKGILPWATITAFDTLKECFQRKDWTKAGLVAADLGHYVADGHMPLHITRNYNGQFTGQTGIHSRYESTMIGKYNSQINYPDDSVKLLADVKSTVFTYLYYNYQLVDSVLHADIIADTVAGGTSGNTYYLELWNHTQDFTTDLFKRASYTLAGLIYTAWVQAGSPNLTPNAIDELSSENVILGQNLPNPFTGLTKIPITVKRNNTHLILEVVDSSGIRCKLLADSIMNHGVTDFYWDGTGFSGGIYYLVLTEGSSKTVKKVILIK